MAPPYPFMPMPKMNYTLRRANAQTRRSPMPLFAPVLNFTLGRANASRVSPRYSPKAARSYRKLTLAARRRAAARRAASKRN